MTTKSGGSTSADLQPVPECPLKYAAGDVIMRSRPWVYSLKVKHILTHCYRCMEKFPLDMKGNTKGRKCGGCACARYCSRKCQNADWKDRHKLECPVMKRATRDRLFDSKSFHGDLLLMYIKIQIKLMKGELEDGPGDCVPPTNRTFLHLLSHREKISETEEAIQLRTETFPQWRSLFEVVDPAGQTFRKNDGDEFLLEIFGKFRINSFGIMSPFKVGHSQYQVGYGIYLGPSVFDHSCDANATQFFDRTALVIRANRNISTLHDVRISYVSAWDSIIQRQAVLEKYCFQCTCALCQDEEIIAEQSAFKCGTDNCSMALPLNDRGRLPCEQCGRINDSELQVAIAVTKALREEYERLRREQPATSFKYLEYLQQLSGLAEKFLHPTNFLLGLFYSLTAPVLLKLKMKEEAFKCVCKAVLPMRSHLNKYDPALLSYLTHLAVWSLEFAPLNQVDYYANECLTQVEQLCGHDHPNSKELRKLAEHCQIATDMVHSL
ncbi:hypothetical protein RvY_05595 [Ramazzottius varieornatus]|uniref:MYND-type domain-containing protein n=1 Tax=Ramazzottius varieornatus TaxID=947166 RepID=A0A1D1V293_RAMVA|nr:hypothetical protein RvY_05595 [Ramazzottius varieornatus]